MKHVDEYRDAGLSEGLLKAIRAAAGRRLRFMEVCGSHTVAIFKSGIRDLLPPEISLVSGPGCPVCVTPVSDIDRAIAISLTDGVILASFGDMLRVPGSYKSLREAKAEGADIRVVYSPADALDIAAKNPDREVVFFSAGFETTTPAVAATISRAADAGTRNFSVLAVNKTIPNAMRALLDTPELGIDGFLCPGHVSTIIGAGPYGFIPEEYGRPAVIAGFEPLDILQAVLMLVRQVESGRHSVEIQYTRAVSPEGNPAAREAVERYFEPCGSDWRGIGVIPESGLRIRDTYRSFDAAGRFEVSIPEPREPKGCSCGSVLRGLISPPECRLFAKACTPESPVGACMVSYEGSCAAYYKYGKR